MSPRAMLLVLTAVLAACRAPETSQEAATRLARESAEATVAIRGLSGQFGRLFSAAQWDSLAAMYTDDAVLMVPNAPPLVGRAAIRAGVAGMGAQMRSYTLTLQADTVIANGPLAVEQGRYTDSGTTTAGIATADTGKYLVQWWKTDSGWRLARDIFNSNLPQPGGN